MQPLDYLFEIIIIVTLSLKIYEFWRNNIRMDRRTLINEEELVLRYARIQRILNKKARINHAKAILRLFQPTYDLSQMEKYYCRRRNKS